MRALTLVADRKLELLEVPEPPPPARGEVRIRVKAIGLKPVGEIVWLAVTLVEFAVIMGIVCWPLSAELLPRLATGAAAANRSVSVAPATSPSTDAGPSPTYSVNRPPLPDASLPGVDLAVAVAVEGFSGGASITTLGAQAGSSGVQSSAGDLGGPTPATRRPRSTD